jgi:hypothetical protein
MLVRVTAANGPSIVPTLCNTSWLELGSKDKGYRQWPAETTATQRARRCAHLPLQAPIGRPCSARSQRQDTTKQLSGALSREASTQVGSMTLGTPGGSASSAGLG